MSAKHLPHDREFCVAAGQRMSVVDALKAGHTIEPAQNANGRIATCADADCCGVVIGGARSGVVLALEKGFAIAPFPKASGGPTKMTNHDIIRAMPEARARPVAAETLIRDFPDASIHIAKTFLRGLPVEAAQNTGTPSAPIDAPAAMDAKEKRILELKLAGLSHKAAQGVPGAIAEHSKLSRFLSLVDRMGVKAASAMSGFTP